MMERYLRELGRGGSPGTSIRAHLTHNTQLSLSLISVIHSHAQDTTRKYPLPLPDHAVVRCGPKRHRCFLFRSIRAIKPPPCVFAPTREDTPVR